MMIELTGVPACGKTTFKEKYFGASFFIAPLDKYIYSKSRICQNFNKIRMTQYAFLHNKDKCTAYLKIIERIHFISVYKKSKVILYLYSIVGSLWKAKEKYKDNCFVVDEGILQIIWAVLYNSINSEEYAWELFDLLKPEVGDIVIQFMIEKELVRNRLLSRNKRGGSSLEHDIKMLEESIDRAKVCWDKIDRKLVGLQGLKVIQYFGGDFDYECCISHK